jgi:hypothetical protein
MAKAYDSQVLALRQSILAMIDAAKYDAEADPRLWAPFVVVGEPAKPRCLAPVATNTHLC